LIAEQLLVIDDLKEFSRKSEYPDRWREANGAKSTAARVTPWLHDASIAPALITFCRSSQHDFVERLDDKLRDELLDLERFRSGVEARGIVEQWRQFYNERWPHGAHRCQPTALVRRAWLEFDIFDTRRTA
jgi:putative transposase